MCGIVGIIGKSKSPRLLVEGLRRLEYRGYDFGRHRHLGQRPYRSPPRPGQTGQSRDAAVEQPMGGTIGIGHTRWATHGVPNEVNAHPHATKYAAVVHNGIIENFLDLRAELTAAGHVFESDTDTEAMVQLISHYLAQGDSPEEATAKMLKRIEGAFALGIIFAGRSDLMIAARRGSPLAIGYGDGEMYLGSDALALAPLDPKDPYLADGDWAVLTADGVAIYDAEGRRSNARSSRRRSPGR